MFTDPWIIFEGTSSQCVILALDEVMYHMKCEIVDGVAHNINANLTPFLYANYYSTSINNEASESNKTRMCHILSEFRFISRFAKLNNQENI
jgi:hypothetical protein